MLVTKSTVRTCGARPLAALVLAFFAASAARAANPTDNPVATFYPGPEGYPAWTDGLRWSRVINMKTYAKGKTAFEKFERARDELAEGGGVLYYPAGTYDFTTMPPGRGLMLRHGVVIRGEAPKRRTLAAPGKLKLATKFVFPFLRRGGGQVPRDWNLIGLQTEKEKSLYNSTDHVGLAWVHLVGAAIFFGPEVDWGKTWGTAGALMSERVKKGWAGRRPDGTHPFDVLAGGGKRFRGAGKGRLVFGCVLEDAAVVDDFSDPGYGPNGFATQRYGARIAVYGTRVLVANNLLPRSRKNFRYRQRTKPPPARGQDRVILYDYGKTCGIDVNKELLLAAGDDGRCPGFFQEGVVVRDNWVFNHGHTGYSVAGTWFTITGNTNERAFLRSGDRVYGAGGWALTLDGWEVARPSSDNRSRAFDLAGRNLWVDGNRFANTGSSPGKDGEGIVCRAEGGTPLYSWAVTHNRHRRGTGSGGGLGGLDVDCHGLLIAWNQTPGWVGNLVKKQTRKMTDCAFVANQAGRVVPDKKAIARLGLPAPRTARTGGALAAPTQVTASVYQGDAVQVTWAAAPGEAIGFRVERRMGGRKWQVIAYRPPRLQGDPDNPQAWVDFTAPPGKELSYRVVAVNADDSDKGASRPTGIVTLGR
jgi:hypothetical protein